MSELGEAVTGPSMGDDGHPEDCVFCEEPPEPIRGYKTKHGELKDEDELERNLWTDAKTDVTRDNAVGPIYPCRAEAT